MTMSQRNKIPGNERWQEHVECVFEEVPAARGKLVRADAKLMLSGWPRGVWLLSGTCPWIGKTGVPSSQQCVSPTHYISLISTSPNPTPHPRTGSRPLSLPAVAPTSCLRSPSAYLWRGIRQHGCNCYSSGEALNIECIMPRAWKAMLEWLERVHADPDYYEARLVVKEVSIDELDKLKDLEDEDSTEEAGETEG